MTEPTDVPPEIVAMLRAFLVTAGQAADGMRDHYRCARRGKWHVGTPRED